MALIFLLLFVVNTCPNPESDVEDVADTFPDADGAVTSNNLDA